MQRVAVITGGTGSLGRALVPRLLAQDMKIAASYIIPEEAEALENELAIPDPEAILLRRVDVTDREALDSFMKEAAERFGAIHNLVCLVGGWAGGRDVEETDDLRFERMLDLNLRSTFYAVRAALPHLREAGIGSIVTIASRAAIENPAGQAAFNIAKAGVIALTKSLANELRGTHINVNAVLPSVIDTPTTRDSMPYADYVHWPEPDEIAAVIEFLLLDDSNVINGAEVPVYGNT
jgi:NAD(P)-dependent dehydrogenase (short-subunit alcohol dehydrogenase family)